MPTERSALEQVNRKIMKVLAVKSWSSELNLVPADDRAVQAFNSLLDYVDQLQRQVKGLEETIRNIR